MPELGVIVALGNGFIITSMIWAGFLAALVDRRTGVAVATLLAGAALTLFGVIHSVDPAGAMYLPWNLAGVGRTLAFQFTAAYVVLAGVIALLSLQRERIAGTA
jgi:AGZA family xanthine/uracil permease-like MFS transporter